MANVELITVEVAYAREDQQRIVSLQVPPGSTVRQAIEQSRILDEFVEIDLDTAKVGVFGKLKKPTEVLRAGDRVEIYRPLIADPKQVRKERAAQGKRMKKGGGESDAGSQEP